MKLGSYRILNAIKTSAYKDAYKELCEYFGMSAEPDHKITTILDIENNAFKIHTWQDGYMYVWEKGRGFSSPVPAFGISMSIVWHSLDEAE